MRYVIVTDVRYRTALAVLRTLGRVGYSLIAVQTAQENPNPPAFSSRYAKKTVLLDGSVKDAAYGDRLKALCEEVAASGERPVLFPIGADTLAMLSGRREEFHQICDFLVAPPEVLDKTNDKRLVAETARKLNIPVPEEYGCETLPPLPVILKPRCGEKLGLHAEQRYRKVYTEGEFRQALADISAYDPQPVVQALVEGDGRGVSVVMDGQHRPVSLICHRRVREYPISGGPSACCESFYDEKLAEKAIELLQELEFVGIAMVEFKGDFLLEINPRIWGSFPLTYVCGSSFAEYYVRCAVGERFPQPDHNYRTGRRMRFVLNDTLATLSYLRHGKIKTALGGVVDLFRAREALFAFSDQRPFWRYLWQTLRGKEGRV